VDAPEDGFNDPQSLRLGLKFLGRTVTVAIDRPLGSQHPDAGFEYLLNYGFVPGVPAPDGEDLDAYVVGLDTAAASATGVCIAIIHRLYEDDDKLVVVKDGVDRDDDCLRELIAFQEDDRPYVINRSSTAP
jgi:inorganic pyrophosphatase